MAWEQIRGERKGWEVHYLWYLNDKHSLSRHESALFPLTCSSSCPTHTLSSSCMSSICAVWPFSRSRQANKMYFRWEICPNYIFDRFVFSQSQLKTVPHFPISSGIIYPPQSGQNRQFPVFGPLMEAVDGKTFQSDEKVRQKVYQWNPNTR